jgi:hypothetical protein
LPNRIAGKSRRTERWDRVEERIDEVRREVAKLARVAPLMERLDRLLDPVALRTMFPVSIHARPPVAQLVADYLAVLLEETGGDVEVVAEAAGIAVVDLRRWLAGAGLTVQIPIRLQ